MPKGKRVHRWILKDNTFPLPIPTGAGVWPWATGSAGLSPPVPKSRSTPTRPCRIFVGTVDLTGTRTTISQMVADELGLDPSEITIKVGDTDSAPYADLSGGSRITYTMSAATHQACQDVLGQLKARAAEKLKVSADEVEYAQKKAVGQERPAGGGDAGGVGPRECGLGQRTDHRQGQHDPHAAGPRLCGPRGRRGKSIRIRARSRFCATPVSRMSARRSIRPRSRARFRAGRSRASVGRSTRSTSLTTGY